MGTPEKRTPETSGNSFDAIRPTKPGDLFALPHGVLSEKRVSELFPGEWTFARPGTLVVDAATNKIMIDTHEPLPESTPDTKVGLSQWPAIMNVSDIGRLTAGSPGLFIADLRHVIRLIRLNRGLSEGPGSREFMEAEQRYGATALAGAILADEDGIMYIGDPAHVPAAESLRHSVDEFFAKLNQEMADQGATTET